MLAQVAEKEIRMIRPAGIASALCLFLFTAHAAVAQCLGDANGDGMVVISEIIQVVNNSLNGCSAPTPTVGPDACPIDFSSDNTAQGTPDCFYQGSWNQSCGAANLQADWISDGQFVVVEFLGFDPPLFYGAMAQSSSSASLIGWFRMSDASDLTDAPGTLTLGPSGQSLALVPDSVPFQIEGCDFAAYNGALIEAVVPTPQTAATRVKVGAVLQRLRAAQRARALPNLERH
jgi:hypothetical protein